MKNILLVFFIAVSTSGQAQTPYESTGDKRLAFLLEHFPFPYGKHVTEETILDIFPRTLEGFGNYFGSYYSFGIKDNSERTFGYRDLDMQFYNGYLYSIEVQKKKAFKLFRNLYPDGEHIDELFDEWARNSSNDDYQLRYQDEQGRVVELKGAMMYLPKYALWDYRDDHPMIFMEGSGETKLRTLESLLQKGSGTDLIKKRNDKVGTDPFIRDYEDVITATYGPREHPTMVSKIKSKQLLMLEVSSPYAARLLYESTGLKFFKLMENMLARQEYAPQMDCSTEKRTFTYFGLAGTISMEVSENVLGQLVFKLEFDPIVKVSAQKKPEVYDTFRDAAEANGLRTYTVKNAGTPPALPHFNGKLREAFIINIGGMYKQSMMTYVIEFASSSDALYYVENYQNYYRLTQKWGVPAYTVYNETAHKKFWTSMCGDCAEHFPTPTFYENYSPKMGASLIRGSKVVALYLMDHEFSKEVGESVFEALEKLSK